MPKFKPEHFVLRLPADLDLAGADRVVARTRFQCTDSLLDTLRNSSILASRKREMRTLPQFDLVNFAHVLNIPRGIERSHISEATRIGRPAPASVSEARQRRITVGNEHDYLDLVFYHRILRCHLLSDLKIRPFRHGDAG